MHCQSVLIGLALLKVYRLFADGALWKPTLIRNIKLTSWERTVPNVSVTSELRSDRIAQLDASIPWVIGANVR